MTDRADGPKGPSLAGRYAAAIGLTIGFYLLALAVAGVLVGGPAYAWIANGSFNIWVTIFGIVTGASILSAIVPRREPFAPPGTRVDAAGQPRLIAAVVEVARSTGQGMPAETYVTFEPNAGVSEVSAGLLRRRKRVLIVGLPLLRLLTQREFTGVLAHEFGHYAGGDTRLGPWVWRTRETIGRTIERLSHGAEDSWSRRAVRAPFLWYGNAFLRITAAISRRQEHAADAIAAREVGRDAHVAALRRIHALAPGFDAYWAEDVAPALAAGYRPPVLAGYAAFLRSERAEQAAAAHLDAVMNEPEAAYASHPGLAARIASVAGLRAGSPDASPPASSLLNGQPALEAAVFADVGVSRDLAPLSWDDAGDRVWLARYRSFVDEYGAALEGHTADDLGELAARPEALAAGLRAHHPDLDAEDPTGLARQLLVAALALRLADAGRRPEALPGEPVTLVDGDDRVAPATLLGELAAGSLSPAAWQERAARLGIAGAPLGYSPMTTDGRASSRPPSFMNVNFTSSAPG